MLITTSNDTSLEVVILLKADCRLRVVLFCEAKHTNSLHTDNQEKNPRQRKEQASKTLSLNC